MSNIFKTTWRDFLRPIWQRPTRVQVAALCYKQSDAGKQVLLITSRDTKRWILPKGWPIDGKDGPGSALQEAWEEAGVEQAEIDPVSIGSFEYQKGLGHGMQSQVRTQVYQACVTKMVDKFPESHERKRKWVTPKEAANMVNEPQLAAILAAF